MKKLFVYICSFVAASVALLSCDGKEEIIGTKPTVEDTEFAYASCDYYVDSNTGLSNFYLVLYNGNLNEEGYVDGDSEVLVLDLYSSSTELVLPVGTFKVVEKSRLASKTALEGRELSLDEYLDLYADLFEIDKSEFSKEELAAPSGNYEGSEFYYQLEDGLDEDGDPQFKYIDYPLTAKSGTTVSLSKTGSDYTVLVNANIDGVDITFKYKGPITVEDASNFEGGEGDEGGSEVNRDSYEAINFSAFTQCEVDYYGAEGGYSFFTVYLGDDKVNLETLEGTGNLLVLEIDPKGSYSTSIPAGDYNMESDDYYLCPYWEDEEGYAMGTMYVQNEQIMMGMTDGHVNISRSGSSYTFDSEIYDDDWLVYYKGKTSLVPTFVDYTKLSAPQKAARQNAAGGKSAKMNLVAPERNGASIKKGTTPATKHSLKRISL